MPKSFEVDEDTYYHLSFLNANCSIEEGKFFINSYIVKITNNSDIEKNYFGVSLNEVQALRNAFKDIYSKQLLNQASSLIDMLQATKVNINIK